MAVEYSNIVPIRMSDEDIRRSEVAVQRLNKPRSTMIREVWREFLDGQPNQSTEKTAS